MGAGPVQKSKIKRSVSERKTQKSAYNDEKIKRSKSEKKTVKSTQKEGLSSRDMLFPGKQQDIAGKQPQTTSKKLIPAHAKSDEKLHRSISQKPTQKSAQKQISILNNKEATPARQQVVAREEPTTTNEELIAMNLKSGEKFHQLISEQQAKKSAQGGQSTSDNMAFHQKSQTLTEKQTTTSKEPISIHLKGEDRIHPSTLEGETRESSTENPSIKDNLASQTPKTVTSNNDLITMQLEEWERLNSEGKAEISPQNEDTILNKASPDRPRVISGEEATPTNREQSNIQLKEREIWRSNSERRTDKSDHGFPMVEDIPVGPEIISGEELRPIKEPIFHSQDEKIHGSESERKTQKLESKKSPFLVDIMKNSGEPSIVHQPSTTITEPSNQLLPQSDLHFTGATEVKRARICSTKSINEQPVVTSQSYSDYDNLSLAFLSMTLQHEDDSTSQYADNGTPRTRRSASLGPYMIRSGAKSGTMQGGSSNRGEFAPVRRKSDAFTQTFPPKDFSHLKNALLKSRSMDVIEDQENTRRSSVTPKIEIMTSASVTPGVFPTPLPRSTQSAKKKPSQKPTSVFPAKKPPVRPKPTSLRRKMEIICPRDGSPERATENEVFIREDDSSAPSMNLSHLGQEAVSIQSLNTSDDWNDALSDQTEDMTIPTEVRRYRGLIRGSSLSYRSRFASCGAADPAYDSDEFEYDYNYDAKAAYSRVNESLQQDDETDSPDVKYNIVVTKESTTNSGGSGGFYSTQTRLGRAANVGSRKDLMESDSRQSSANIKFLKPVNYSIGEPGEKRRREDENKFAQLLLLHNNQTSSNDTVTSQGIINYGLVSPTHSRDSSYDNNNNSNNTDPTEEKTQSSKQKRSPSTSSQKNKKTSMSAPTIPSPMSDGMPDFGTIVETVTAVRSKTSPQGSTSGVSSSSSSQSSTLVKQNEIEGVFNENDEWAQIAKVMKSVGSSLNKGAVYAQEFEETFWKIMTGSDLPRRVGTWLSDLNLSQYEEVLCGNGFDNVNFLASDILDNQDLMDMNILNSSHRRKMLDSAKNLPKIRPLNSHTDDNGPSNGGPANVNEWLASLDLSDLEETFNMMGFISLDRVREMKETEIAALVNLRGHRKRISASLGHLISSPTSNKARSMSQGSGENSRSDSRSRLKSSPPLPRSPLLDKVNFFKDYSQKTTLGNTVKSNSSAPSTGSYSTGTASSNSSALTNFSSLSDQVVPDAISEEPAPERPRRGSASRHSRNQSSSPTHHRRRSRDKTQKFPQKSNDFSNLSFGENITNDHQDSLSIAISRLTENPVQRDVVGSTQEDKENSNMTTEASDIRVPDARRASYLSSTGGELVLRPPNETTEEVTVSSWCHDPDNLIKSCCNYQAYYLGSMLVHEVKGVESTVEACAKMKKSTDSMKKIPTVTLSISYRGVKFIDSKSKHEIAEHEIHNISFASQDADDLSTLAYITRDARTDHHYCHVFRVTTLDVAYEIILTLGQAFEVAYQLILKEKAIQEGTV